MADLLEELSAGYSQSQVERWRQDKYSRQCDYVAEETPVALLYNGVSHAVMLATALNLEDFALGFSLSEGILHHRGELEDLEVTPRVEGIEIKMTIARERFMQLRLRRRNLTGRTGCGLCGTESLAQAIRRPPRVGTGVTVASAGLHQAFTQLHGMQRLQHLTGAVHAAAWADTDGRVQLVREDVGRHNALDKLIGALASRRVDFDSGFVIVTSRASYEMVQKTATAGISLFAAISAPTGLAIRLAEEAALTLIGFARGRDHVIYAHPQRIQAGGYLPAEAKSAEI